MNLKHLTDQQLLSDTHQLVREERKISLQILHHLKEIDRRRLYCDIGHGSLFDYVVKELGYSPGSAYRRIQAARMIKDVPCLEEKLMQGRLNFTQISEAANFFKEQQIQEPKRKEMILSSIEMLSKKDTQRHLANLAGKAMRKFIPIPLSNETIEKVDQWRDLQGQGSSDELISGALDVAIESRLQTKQRSSLKREVYSRDQHRCANCGSSFQLQIDHMKPKALGGMDIKENLRVLCFACNQRARLKAGL